MAESRLKSLVKGASGLNEIVFLEPVIRVLESSQNYAYVTLWKAAIKEKQPFDLGFSLQSKSLDLEKVRDELKIPFELEQLPIIYCHWEDDELISNHKDFDNSRRFLVYEKTLQKVEVIEKRQIPNSGIILAGRSYIAVPKSALAKYDQTLISKTDNLIKKLEQYK